MFKRARKLNKTLKVIILSLIFSLTLSACGKSDLYYDPSEVFEPKDSSPELDLQLKDLHRPKVDEGALDSEKKVAEEETKSLYALSLDTKEQEMFTEIEETIKTKGKNYIATADLSKDEALKLLKIISLDAPEFFYLKPDFYLHTENDKVKSIDFSYYDIPMDDIHTILVDFKVNNDKELKLSRAVYEDLAKNLMQSKGFNFRSNLKYLLENEDLMNETMLGVYQKNASEIALSQAYTYYLRRNGVNVLSVYGKRLDDGFNYNTYDYSKLFTLRKNQDTIRFTISKNNVNAWNLVNISGNWYHVDIPLGTKISKQLKDTIGTNLYDNFFTFLVSDEESSLSKLFYMNEDIVSNLPMSYDDYFNIKKEEANIYFTSKSKQQLKQDFKDKLPKQKIKKGLVKIAFADEDNYNQAQVLLPLWLEELVKEEAVDFNNFKTIAIDEVKMIFIYDIK